MKKSGQILEKIENAPSVNAIKSGLIMIIPVLLIGSVALVFLYFPITQYQQFITTALSGKLLSFFTVIYNATFGMMAVYLTVAISFCYSRGENNNRSSLISPITSLICFSILSGVRIDNVTWDALGVKGVFLAIISSLIATKMLIKISAFTQHKKHGYMDGADVEFNQTVSMIIPCAVVVAVFALADSVILTIFGENSVFELFVDAANAMFIPLGRSFVSGILMVFVSSLLWFFGIHGSDVLESVMVKIFTPAININIGLIAAGKSPTEIFTKQFFDVFVLMGGCGTAICLLLSVILFSKRKRNRRISKLAALPMLFNINELMIFGYPVIFNYALIIPFLITPLVCFLTTYFSMRLGLVPYTCALVNWTAPVLLSGYMATGSLAGSALQLFNIVIGCLIYRPFIKMYDRRCDEENKKQIDELVRLKTESEMTLEPICLTELNSRLGALARSLASDLKYALSENSIVLYYQPQYDSNYKCFGAEALLRWEHPIFGMLYPPLVIQLARETNILTELESYILKHAVNDVKTIRNKTGFNAEISVNISALTLQTPQYLELLKELSENNEVGKNEFCLEVTEQTAIQINSDTFDILQKIRDMGYSLAIDDFSMGHTSLTYLKDNHFGQVKLDGELITTMTDNPRSYDIIKTITQLSDTFGVMVVAEYVENEEQVKMLSEVGCTHYQGYLFSKAITPEEWTDKLKNEKTDFVSKE